MSGKVSVKNLLDHARCRTVKDKLDSLAVPGLRFVPYDGDKTNLHSIYVSEDGLMVCMAGWCTDLETGPSLVMPHYTPPWIHVPVLKYRGSLFFYFNYDNRDNRLDAPSVSEVTKYYNANKALIEASHEEALQFKK